MSASYPDPLLSASLCGTGRLEALIVEVVDPFWLEAKVSASDSYLWMLRYGRRGEHLKLHLHGPEDLAAPRPAAGSRGGVVLQRPRAALSRTGDSVP